MKTVKIRGKDAPPCITPIRKVMIAQKTSKARKKQKPQKPTSILTFHKLLVAAVVAAFSSQHPDAISV
jgi:hypothetical protein